MAKRKETGQVSAQAKPTSRNKLTWREERFIEEYIDNGGNATGAARAVGIPAPAEQGYRMLNYAHVQEGLEKRREELRRALGFDRKRALQILVGMACATLDDFAPLFKDVADRRKYRGLGLKRHALESAKKTVTYTEDGEKEVNEIKILSAGERRAAINDLRDMLGLDKENNSQDGRTHDPAILEAISKATGERS